MYSFDSRIRYSETDERGRLSILGVMNYLQDCSTFQSESLGVGIEYLKKAKKAWWLAAWKIELIDLPKLADIITVSTWAYGFHGFYGNRNFTIQNESGEYLLKADSLWLFYDLEHRKPSAPSEEDTGPYLKEKMTRLDMPALERRIIPSGKGKTADPIIVQKHHLDTNRHVNNAQYIEMARDVLPADYKISEIEVQYKNAAALGERIIPVVYEGVRSNTVDLTNKDGVSYALVRMQSL